MNIENFKKFLEEQYITKKGYKLGKKSIDRYIIVLRNAENISEKSTTAEIIKQCNEYLKKRNSLLVYYAIITWLKYIKKENLKKRLIKPAANKRNFQSKVLSKEEIRLLIEKTKNLKYKLIIRMLYETGCRIDELFSIKTEDIKYDPETKLYEICILGKGGKERKVWFSENTDFLLKKYMKKDRGQIFKTKTTSAWKQIRILGKKILKRKVTPHYFRHSFATHLKDAGEDILVIKELLGHSSLNTTMRYAQIGDTTKKRAITHLHKISQSK